MLDIRRSSLVSILLLGVVTATQAQIVFDPLLQVDTWASGLSRPTTFAILPQGPELDMLVCEKPTGRVIWMRNGLIQGTALDVAVNFNSERGLLGIALHPDFANNGFVYVYYTASSTGVDTELSSAVLEHRVERYTWNGSTLAAPQTLLTLPATGGPNHDGGIILFGPDQRLYGVIGDLNRDGQLENFPSGAEPDDTAIIFRIGADGSTPPDNPFFALGGTMQKVYAYGVRNSFGMDFDPVSGVLWDTENGPASYDEINRVLPGFNSGWEQIMGPDSRDPQGVADLWVAPGSVYSDPEFSWLATIGVTSIHFVRGDVLGTHLENDILIGDNNTGSLFRFEPNPARTGLIMPTVETADLVADNTTERNTFRFGSGFGVVTDIETGPDGVYVASYLSGEIYRISRTPTAEASAAVIPLSLHVSPNPATAATWVRLLPNERPLPLEARIYSPAGRLVQVLRGISPVLAWDGRDATGQRVPAGVYVVRVETGNRSTEAKIVRLSQ